MEKRAIDVAKALVRLSEVTIFELRGERRRLHRMPPPVRGAAKPTPFSLRTLPVREWRGVTHTALNERS
jgi:hypothetical protein